MKVNLITRKLKLVVSTEHFDYWHILLPSKPSQNSGELAHLATFLSIVSNKDLSPLWMSLPSTSHRKKRSSDYIPPLWLFLSQGTSLSLPSVAWEYKSFLFFSFLTYDKYRFHVLKSSQMFSTAGKLIFIVIDYFDSQLIFKFSSRLLITSPLLLVPSLLLFFFFTISTPLMVNLRVSSQAVV